MGGYLPRQCGIATFTTDLCESVAAEYSEVSTIALPVNDTKDGYTYPNHVRFELAEKDIHSFRSAADFLNINNVDLVCLQHEYGIFGGRGGSYILALLHELRMPIVTTLHTVLQDPDPDQRRVLQEIVALSDRLVVMSGRASEFMQEIYQAPVEKIDLIHHGIPDVPFVDPAFYKDQFGVEGQQAQTMISACLEAYRVTSDRRWRQEANRAFEWFLGRNDLNLPLYDPITGGCRDGLHPDRANENQGAESTLAFLHALLELRLAENTLQSVESSISIESPV